MQAKLSPTLRITEIFHSLQGEARTAGRPTVFVRLTGCPLRCGYCDTAYAFSGGESRTVETILEEVAQYAPRFITVTGVSPWLNRMRGAFNSALRFALGAGGLLETAAPYPLQGSIHG